MANMPDSQAQGALENDNIVTETPDSQSNHRVPEQSAERRDEQNCPSLQTCFRPWTFLLIVCGLALTQSMLVTGYTGSIITTLELQFNLKSSQSGLIISSYDIACMVVVIIVSYCGDGRHNRARWLGIGSLLMFIGAIIFTIPNFLGDYHYSGLTEVGNVTVFNPDINLCNSTRTFTDGEVCDDSVQTSHSLTLALFMISQMIIGFGASPVYTLGPTYLYDNVDQHLYSIYAGIMFSMSALGPALGFLMGAGLLSFYVDPFNKPLNMDENSPNWVGAWWIGFLLCGAIALLVSVPLMFFPRELPKRHSVKNEDLEEEKVDGPDEIIKPVVVKFGSIKDFGKKTWSLLQNKIWLFISLATVMEQIIISGFVAFIAKYFQVTFDFTASKSNIITGAVIIPAAFTGIIFGGCLMKRFRFDIPDTCRLLLLLTIGPVIGVLGLMFLGCGAVPFAGVTDTYDSIGVQSFDGDVIKKDISIEPPDLPNLLGDCNVDCQCQDSSYSPVCGSNGFTYFNPCFAGCQQTFRLDQFQNFTSCACIKGSEWGDLGVISHAGKCDIQCSNFVPFLIVLFIMVFLTSCGQNPALMILLRCVDSDSKSFALGLQNVMARILAFIPAPIYFGKIFDSQCLIWSEGCDLGGSCLEYNSDMLPYVLFGMCFGIKIITMFLLAMTYYSSLELKKPTSYEVNPESQEVKGQNPLDTEEADQGHVFTTKVKFNTKL